MGAILDDDGAAVAAGRILLDQARIIEGETPPDPAAFARRMTHVMTKGLAG